MQQSTSLIYLAIDAASLSKLMPSDLGNFDGLRNSHLTVLTLMDDENGKFVRQEHLGLYPKVSKANGLYKAEVDHRRGPGRSSEAVELATLEQVDWFNHRRLLELIGNSTHYRQLAESATLA